MKKIFNKEFAEGVVLFHLMILPSGMIISSILDFSMKTIITNIYYLVVIGCAMAVFYNYDEEKEELRKLKSERK